MKRKATSGMMLTLLLIGMLTVSSVIRSVKSESTETIIHEIVWEDEVFHVVTTSNSSITPVPILFDQPRKMLTFNATGPEGTTGFCDIVIPRELLDSFTNGWSGAGV